MDPIGLYKELHKHVLRVLYGAARHCSGNGQREGEGMASATATAIVFLVLVPLVLIPQGGVLSEYRPGSKMTD